MTRLRHSAAAYLRSMQMSAYQLWVFVEGKTVDRYFYGKLVEDECRLHGVRYKMVLAEELPEASGGGGKNVLLSFFTYLRERKALFTTLDRKSTTTIFFLDKDVDDLAFKRKRSPHLAYTEYYCVENYLFKHGDVVEATAACLHLDRYSLELELGAQDQWRMQAVARWRDWLTLCLASTLLNLGLRNYNSRSLVNKHVNGPVDPSKVEAARTELARAAGKDTIEFNTFYKIIEGKVDRHYSTNRHDYIFNGKWYAQILEHDVAAFTNHFHVSSNGISKRIASNLLQTLNYRERWSDRFRHRIRLQLTRLASSASL